MFRVLLFSIFFPIFLSAQSKPGNEAIRQSIDSLYQRLKIAEHDTIKMNTLSAVASKYEKINNDSAVSALIRAVNFAASAISSTSLSPYEQRFYKRHAANIYNSLGYINKKRGNLSESIRNYGESIKAWEDLGNKSGLAEVLNNIGLAYEVRGEKDKQLKAFERALKLNEEINDSKGMASVLNSLGSYYSNAGNNLKAKDYYERSMAIRIRMNDKEGIATTLNNMARMYEDRGDIPTALEYYDRCLDLFEEIKDKRGMAIVLINMGVTLKNQGDYARSLEYWGRSMKLMDEAGDKRVVATILNNIGYVYYNFGDPDVKTSRSESMKAGVPKALEYYEKSLTIKKNMGDKDGIATVLNNMGGIYRDKGDPSVTSSLDDSKAAGLQKALDYFTQSYELYKEVGNKRFLASALNNIGGIYFRKKEYSKALEYTKSSMEMAREANLPQSMREAANLQYEIYKVMGEHTKALENYEIYIQMRDSLNNLETQKASIKQQAKYEYEKKEALNKAEYDKQQALAQSEIERRQILIEKNRQSMLLLKQENELKQLSLLQSEAELKQKKTEADNQEKTITLLNKESEIKSAEAKQKEETLKKQKVVIYATSLGVLLVLILLGVAIYGYRQKRRANQIITLQKEEVEKQKDVVVQQKHIIEEKQKEIVDSINYAKRIQYTLLAHDGFLKENLREYFTYFQPKDIVSGDFYWAALHKDRFYLAVCDSTGHGVPGAFMSLLNIGFLTEAINEKGIEQPNEVFDFVREKLISTVSKEGQKDGFDGILLCIDKKNRRITYAAANNAPVLIQNGQLTEMESDRMPVGVGERKEKFKLHHIEAKPGDMLYLYTDGYADQFGGPKGKKFKYKQLNELLQSLSSLSLEAQHIQVRSVFEDWKGSLEQIDDVCVIGIRIA